MHADELKRSERGKWRALRMGFAVLALMIPGAAWADDGNGAPAASPLAIFDPLVGKTWRGVSSANDGNVDMIRWERIMGGKAVQSTHSINDGEYGGRTIFFYSPNEDKLLFHYFTTANFHSTGEMKIEDNGELTVTEEIHGLDNLPEVRARLVFHEDGWEMKSSYKRDGEWVAGDGYRYREAPGAQVRFQMTGE